jgi:hypothetical protein
MLYRIAPADETDIPDACYEKVALWSDSNTWGSLIGFAKPLQIALVISMDEEGYARVLCNDLVGYIHSDYLQIVCCKC